MSDKGRKVSEETWGRSWRASNAMVGGLDCGSTQRCSLNIHDAYSPEHSEGDFKQGNGVVSFTFQKALSSHYEGGNGGWETAGKATAPREMMRPVGKERGMNAFTKRYLGIGPRGSGAG